MTHNDEEMRIIEEYQAAVDEYVLKFVDNVLSDSEHLNFITVAFMSEVRAKEIESLTGKTNIGRRVVLDDNAVRHIIKRHGPAGKKDCSMKKSEDIARMGYVIMNYDRAEYEELVSTGYSDENGGPAPLIRLSKKIDGTYYVVEAITASKRRMCHVVTAYIQQ